MIEHEHINYCVHISYAIRVLNVLRILATQRTEAPHNTENSSVSHFIHQYKYIPSTSSKERVFEASLFNNVESIQKWTPRYPAGMLTTTSKHVKWLISFTRALSSSSHSGYRRRRVKADPVTAYFSLFGFTGRSGERWDETPTLLRFRAHTNGQCPRCIPVPRKSTILIPCEDILCPNTNKDVYTSEHTRTMLLRTIGDKTHP